MPSYDKRLNLLNYNSGAKVIFFLNLPFIHLLFKEPIAEFVDF